jgi:hypothetical protein
LLRSARQVSQKKLCFFFPKISAQWQAAGDNYTVPSSIDITTLACKRPRFFWRPSVVFVVWFCVLNTLLVFYFYSIYTQGRSSACTPCPSAKSLPRSFLTRRRTRKRAAQHRAPLPTIAKVCDPEWKAGAVLHEFAAIVPGSLSLEKDSL